MPKPPKLPQGMPTRQQVLDFIQSSDIPAGKREIAQAARAYQTLMMRLLSEQRGHQRLRLAAFLRGPATPAAAHRCLRGLFSPREIALLLQHWGLAGATAAADDGGCDGVHASAAA